ncbi:MAG: hypothetical protein LBK97_04785, partial [Prevotellaceae bacterium]|nr:hypothetical protein [Prevotellaceae bacterium]
VFIICYILFISHILSHVLKTSGNVSVYARRLVMDTPEDWIWIRQKDWIWIRQKDWIWIRQKDWIWIRQKAGYGYARRLETDTSLGAVSRLCRTKDSTALILNLTTLGVATVLMMSLFDYIELRFRAFS